MVEHVARHLANRAELLKAIEAKRAEWHREDDARDRARSEHWAALMQGLKDVDAVIVAAGGEVPSDEPEHTEAAAHEAERVEDAAPEPVEH